MSEGLTLQSLPFNPFPLLTHWPDDLNVFLNWELQTSAPHLQRKFFFFGTRVTEGSRAPPKGKLCSLYCLRNRDSGLEKHLAAVLTYNGENTTYIRKYWYHQWSTKTLIQVMEWLKITILSYTRACDTRLLLTSWALFCYSMWCKMCGLLIGIQPYKLCFQLSWLLSYVILVT